MNILISAYGCGPGRGSEPGVGWNWSRELATKYPVWVLTPESERAAIESYQGSDRPHQLHFIHCDLPCWCRPSLETPGIQYHLHYYAWQILAYIVAKRLHRTLNFRVVHHLVLGAHWKPSFLALLPIPFLWGPLGGGESVPRGFMRDFPFRGRLMEWLRVFVRSIAEMDPFLKVTARRSRLTLTKTQDTAVRVANLGSARVQVFSEAALPVAELDRLGSLPVRSSGPFRFIAVGRLIYWKGYALGIRAFHLALREHPDAEMWLVGNGSERSRLERLANTLGISAQVRFLGELPRAAISEMLSRCDVLVHPSLHDSGGWACLEGMAARKPVICLDLGGPAVQVTDETGFKIRALSPDQTVQDLASAMVKLAGNRQLVAKMGQAGRNHVLQNYTWRKKALSFVPMYEQLASYSEDFCEEASDKAQETVAL